MLLAGSSVSHDTRAENVVMLETTTLEIVGAVVSPGEGDGVGPGLELSGTTAVTVSPEVPVMPTAYMAWSPKVPVTSTS